MRIPKDERELIDKMLEESRSKFKPVEEWIGTSCIFCGRTYPEYMLKLFVLNYVGERMRCQDSVECRKRQLKQEAAIGLKVTK